MVVAPIMAADSDDVDIISVYLTGALMLWLIVVFAARYVADEKDAEKKRLIAREKMYSDIDARLEKRAREEMTRYARESDRLLAISPTLDEMLVMIDASHSVNGEILMDYTRFRQCLDEARRELALLDISLPCLNEGGDAAIFHRTLRRVAAYAQKGDVTGARHASMG